MVRFEVDVEHLERLVARAQAGLGPLPIVDGEAIRAKQDEERRLLDAAPIYEAALRLMAFPTCPYSAGSMQHDARKALKDGGAKS